MIEVTLACMTCGGPYVKPRRRMSHFCPPCRADRNREQTRLRMAASRAVRVDLLAVLEGFESRGMDPDYLDLLRTHIDDDLGLKVLQGDVHAVVPDRMPPGANSPSGPEDGTSTYFKDLADELDLAHKAVSLHPWFTENPHWAYDLHGTQSAQ